MPKNKLHLCFDKLPKDEKQMIAWADQAAEINPQNAPQQAIAQASVLASVCMSMPGFDVAEMATYFNRAEMALLTSKKWQTGQEITFGFMRASTQIATHARNGFSEVAKHANLKFTEVAAASAIIRIADYEEGAYSYLGTDAKGIPKNQQTMNLARSWADLATSIHEICHAVGMIHEHQSPAGPADLWNEEAVYRAYSGPPNNWSRAMIKSNVLDRYTTNQTQYTTWDRKSIMLYPLDAALLKNPSYATGWNKALSAADKEFLGKIYPFADQPPEPPEPPPPPTTEADILVFTTIAKKLIQVKAPPGYQVVKM